MAIPNSFLRPTAFATPEQADVNLQYFVKMLEDPNQERLNQIVNHFLQETLVFATDDNSGFIQDIKYQTTVRQNGDMNYSVCIILGGYGLDFPFPLPPIPPP